MTAWARRSPYAPHDTPLVRRSPDVKRSGATVRHNSSVRHGRFERLRCLAAVSSELDPHRRHGRRPAAGIILCGFSFEPVRNLPIAIAVALALMAYVYAFARADQADPKLIFSLGAISQMFFVVIDRGAADLRRRRGQLAVAGSRPAGDRSRAGNGSGDRSRASSTIMTGSGACCCAATA